MTIPGSCADMHGPQFAQGNAVREGTLRGLVALMPQASFALSALESFCRRCWRHLDRDWSVLIVDNPVVAGHCEK